MNPAHKRRLARKSERGATVLIVVLVLFLVTAIGVFAVGNSNKIERAVGYSRQASQTAALAELGTTAALSEFGANKASIYVTQMINRPETCFANAQLPPNATPCARLFRTDLEQSTLDTLLEPTGVGEVGSLGGGGVMVGDVYVEVTERYPTGRPVAGTDLSGTGGVELKYAKVTLTTTAQIRPAAVNAADNDVCAAAIAATAANKVMRARVVVGPI